LSGLFVTGTDTDCGKTLVTLGLMRGLQQRGLTVNGFKPVAAGCEMLSGRLVNPDAWQILRQSSAADSLSYAEVNPYLFQPAIAPHIAAREDGKSIDLAVVENAYCKLQEMADLTVVEGAGGWLVPLDQQHAVSDIARRLKLPVILVVGIRLGCINHARLSLNAIHQSGCRIAGWIGSQTDANMLRLDENIATLRDYLDVPCLGIVPYLEKPDARQVATCLHLSPVEKILS
jgi:dethiobiotin synthetase